MAKLTAARPASGGLTAVRNESNSERCRVVRGTTTTISAGPWLNVSSETTRAGRCRPCSRPSIGSSRTVQTSDLEGRGRSGKGLFVAEPVGERRLPAGALLELFPPDLRDFLHRREPGIRRRENPMSSEPLDGEGHDLLSGKARFSREAGDRPACRTVYADRAVCGSGRLHGSLASSLSQRHVYGIVYQFVYAPEGSNLVRGRGGRWSLRNT